MQNETSAWSFERVLSAFEEAGVKHLVMDGRVAVVYGAAQYTQGADLWIEPTAQNLTRLLKA